MAPNQDSKMMQELQASLVKTILKIMRLLVSCKVATTMNCKNWISREVFGSCDSGSYLPMIWKYVSDILEMEVRLLD